MLDNRGALERGKWHLGPDRAILGSDEASSKGLSVRRMALQPSRGRRAVPERGSYGFRRWRRSWTWMMAWVWWRRGNDQDEWIR